MISSSSGRVEKSCFGELSWELLQGRILVLLLSWESVVDSAHAAFACGIMCPKRFGGRTQEARLVHSFTSFIILSDGRVV